MLVVFDGDVLEDGLACGLHRVDRLMRLNAHWFLTVADAQEIVETWRRYYNEDRRARRHWQQAADLIAKPRWRTQPATVTKAGKLYPPAVQSSGADQTGCGSLDRVSTELGADQLEHLPDGSLRVCFRAGRLFELAWHLFTWGQTVIIEAPPELNAILDQALEVSRARRRPEHG